jgi:hypothetical protein
MGATTAPGRRRAVRPSPLPREGPRPGSGESRPPFQPAAPPSCCREVHERPIEGPPGASLQMASVSSDRRAQEAREVTRWDARPSRSNLMLHRRRCLVSAADSHLFPLPLVEMRSIGGTTRTWWRRPPAVPPAPAVTGLRWRSRTRMEGRPRGRDSRARLPVAEALVRSLVTRVLLGVEDGEWRIARTGATSFSRPCGAAPPGQEWRTEAGSASAGTSLTRSSQGLRGLPPNSPLAGRWMIHLMAGAPMPPIG